MLRTYICGSEAGILLGRQVLAAGEGTRTGHYTHVPALVYAQTTSTSLLGPV